MANRRETRSSLAAQSDRSGNSPSLSSLSLAECQEARGRASKFYSETSKNAHETASPQSVECSPLDIDSLATDTLETTTRTVDSMHDTSLGPNSAVSIVERSTSPDPARPWQHSIGRLPPPAPVRKSRGTDSQQSIVTERSGSLSLKKMRSQDLSTESRNLASWTLSEHNSRQINRDIPEGLLVEAQEMTPQHKHPQKVIVDDCEASPATHQEQQPESADLDRKCSIGDQLPPTQTTATAPTKSIPQVSEILQTASTLPLTHRFVYLLAHTCAIIQSRGPYTLNASGHLTTTSTSHNHPIATDFARTLALAQDCVHTPQPPGTCLNDLRIFTHLHTTAIALLSKVLQSHSLSLNPWGWGIYGLSVGYSGRDDQLFASQANRLHTALQALPGLEGAAGALTEAERVLRASQNTESRDVLSAWSRAQKNVHICATMMMQSMSKNGWDKVRWGCVIRVVERWVQHLGWVGDDGEGVLGEGDSFADEWSEVDGLWVFRGRGPGGRGGSSFHERRSSLA